jgi:hypothetical protein
VTVQGDNWARGGYYRDARGTVAAGETSAGGRAAAARTSQGTAYAGRSASGDLYAGRDGNVYKKSGGEWQQRDSSGNWSSTQRPETSRDLQSSADSRSRGWQNTSRSTQRSSGMSGSRGGGGRGGGGRGRR